MQVHAQWIWINEKCVNSPEYVLFRKVIQMKDIPQKLVLSITADSRYILSINGKIVCRGPAKSSLSVKYYDTVDIAPYLQTGENVVAIDGIHYPGDRYLANQFAAGPLSVPSTMHGGVLLFGDKRFCTNNSYRCKRLDAYTFKKANIAEYIGYMEQMDARLYPFGWREVGYDDNNWTAPVCMAPNASYTMGGLSNVWQIEPNPLPLSYRTDRQFAEITRSSKAKEASADILTDGILVKSGHSEFVELDAGIYRVGYPELLLEGGDGSWLEITYAESYGSDSDGHYVKENRSDCTKAGSYLLGDSDLYYLKNGQQEYTPTLYRAFRFIRLDIHAGNQPVRVRVKGYVETGYPLEVSTVMQCSNESYNAIWDISLHTLRCCMQETYIDCPYYEQMQYVLDAMLESVYTYCVSVDGRLAKKAIRDFYEAQLPDGLIPCNAPSCIVQIIPAFSLYWVFMLNQYYWYFGDKEVIQAYFPGVEKVISYFAGYIDEKNLLTNTGFWQFVDWVSEWDNGTPISECDKPNGIYTMIFVSVLKTAADMADAIHRGDTAQEYRKMAQQISIAVNTYCYDECEEMYRDTPEKKQKSQHAQIWAVLSGIADNEKKGAVLKQAMSRNDIAQCSLCYRYFLLRALETADLYNLSEPLWSTWDELRNLDLTTWPEDTVNWRSDCHAWSATPLYEMVRCGLGIRPGSPGFRTVQIAPTMMWLKSYQGSYQTPQGRITVSWKQDNGFFRIEVNAEKPMDIVLNLPDGSVNKLNGVKHITKSCSLTLINSNSSFIPWKDVDTVQESCRSSS